MFERLPLPPQGKALVMSSLCSELHSVPGLLMAITVEDSYNDNDAGISETTESTHICWALLS